jgi:hypothetical protein
MRTLLLFIGIGIMAMGCLESFSPPKSNTDVNFLAISANLNATNGTIRVSLSRALPLDSNTAVFPKVSNAIITLKGTDGNHFDVLSIGPNGVYENTQLNIDRSVEYALNVKIDGQEYESDFIKITQSPLIENVEFEKAHDGLQIVLSTKDPSNNSRYYEWQYTETYIEQAAAVSHYIYNNEDSTVRGRSMDQFIHVCYDNNQSSSIVIASTERLANDVVNKIPIISISKNSPKLEFGYSILIKQRVLTKEAYSYFEKLKASTESLGGLFDPQPSSVLGNFRNINNSNETVLGYFTGGEETTYRYFIFPSNLPPDLRPNIPLPYCPQDTLFIEDIKQFRSQDYILTDDLRANGEIIGYRFVDLSCGDCTKKGGTTTKPDFWPN